MPLLLKFNVPQILFYYFFCQITRFLQGFAWGPLFAQGLLNCSSLGWTLPLNQTDFTAHFIFRPGKGQPMCTVTPPILTHDQSPLDWGQAGGVRGTCDSRSEKNWVTWQVDSLLLSLFPSSSSSSSFSLPLPLLHIMIQTDSINLQQVLWLKVHI